MKRQLKSTNKRALTGQPHDRLWLEKQWSQQGSKREKDILQPGLGKTEEVNERGSQAGWVEGCTWAASAHS